MAFVQRAYQFPVVKSALFPLGPVNARLVVRFPARLDGATKKAPGTGRPLAYEALQQAFFALGAREHGGGELGMRRFLHSAGMFGSTLFRRSPDWSAEKRGEKTAVALRIDESSGGKTAIFCDNF